jgi:transcriptional regulator with XRE-family HTH domain
VADRCDLARGTLSAYERGTAKPTPPTLERVVQVLGGDVLGNGQR